MVRANCVLHRAGVVTAMLLSHHGDGEGAAEAVHARNHYVMKDIFPFMLPVECQRNVSFSSFTGQACSGANCEVGRKVEWTD